MKKALKILFVVLTCLLAFLLVSTAVIYIHFSRIAKSEVFNFEKLASSKFQIQVFDDENNLIEDNNQFNNQNISIEEIPKITKQAFISIEDKTFYSHNGVNYKRIAKALLKNLTSGSRKEGASTISQQLIKNTHLTNEKTYTRKIKELFLAKEMEKQLSKDEILESYLNVIYFGNNIYGIENASNFYFSKPAKLLNLNESATLAAIIKSPGQYSPITKPENCKKRRNLVLLEMLKDKKISQEEYEEEKAKELPLNINQNFNSGQNSYSMASINEACEILGLKPKELALGGYKIYTYNNVEKQKALEDAIKNQLDVVQENDIGGISINNQTGGVEAFYGKISYSILNYPRQPGSIIKPLLVYGPAMNENLISPATKNLDEPININGYSPKNVSKNFDGYISVRNSIAKSSNIPAVKTLSYVGIDKAKKYAERLGITFAEEDTGYALALGGMTYGTDLKTLTNAYTTFANSGKFKKASFVKEIKDKNDKIIYTSNQPYDHVFREDANYLTLNAMFETAKTGTAKRLGKLDYEVAAKTGTVGKGSSNSDAYNITLTSEDTVGVWIGNFEGKEIGKITGGIEPTYVIKDYFEKIYETHKPKNFEIPSSIEEIEIDALELENNHILVKANDYTPSRYKKTEIFSKFNLPKESSVNFVEIKPTQLSGKVENGEIHLKFNAKNYLSYDLYRINNGQNILEKSFDGQNGVIEYTTPFYSTNDKYYLITKLINYATSQTLESEPSEIIEFMQTKKEPTQKKQVDKWYI
ncbi:MAG: penicillin-binding protein [Clostridia bacterium]|nr:penicillin-binding protein [Clostridia bacterium]